METAEPPWFEDNAAPESAKDQALHRFGNAALIVNSRSRAARSAAAEALDYLRLLSVPINTTLVLEDPTRLPETGARGYRRRARPDYPRWW